MDDRFCFRSWTYGGAVGSTEDELRENESSCREVMLVCVQKVSYGKGHGAYTVEVGETVERVLVCGTQMYRAQNGRYLAPYLYSKYFKDER